MEKSISKCGKCWRFIRYDSSSEGSSINCPNCQNSVVLAKIDVASLNISIIPIDISTKQDDVKTASKDLPERMKANKAIAGTICSVCEVGIELGEDVFNCQACKSSSMHATCYTNNKGCGNSACKNKPAIVKQGESFEKESAPLPPDMKECTYCGERIKSIAKKCPYCHEIIDEALRAAEEIRAEKKTIDTDDKLEIWEIIFCILCSGIACILGIVYVVQGKPKGWKMILIATITQVVIGVVFGRGKHY